MKRNELKDMFGTSRPIMGMLHLPALPGAPNHMGSMDKVITHALTDAQTLVENGVPALIIENLGDFPYYPMTTEPETVAAMTRVALEVRRAYPNIPLGINVLRNSWKSAIAIAHLCEAQFIRLNILTDGMVTDQGPINGEAHLALRYRKTIGAEHVRLFCDLYCKHAAPITPRDIATVAHEMVERGMADALIVSGPETPVPPTEEHIEEVRNAVPDTPLFLGSGMTVDAISRMAKADGTIFGYGTKPSGNMNDPVDGATVKAFMDAASRMG